MLDMTARLKNFSWYIIPVLGIILSLPTLLACLAFVALVGYEIMIGDMKGTLLLSILDGLQPSLVPFLLYIVFGPIFTCVLCTVQLSRARQEGASVSIAGSTMYRITRRVLFFAAITICVLVLMGGVARIIRGPT
jgi:hypothetical protein